jgi:exonuclease 3'-5' domain-containing protein 1
MFEEETDGQAHPESLIYARVCHVFAKFVYSVMRVVDSWVPLYGAQQQTDMRWVAQQRDSCWQFFFQFYEHLALQASDSKCGKYLVYRAAEWVLAHPPQEILMLVDNPAARVARFVDALSLNAACLATDAWDNYIQSGSLSKKQIPLDMHAIPEEGHLYQKLTGFFHHFTVNQDNGDLTCCLSATDPRFVESRFRVCLVDDYGSLLNLLYHLSKLKHMCNMDPMFQAAVAVDLEGLKLSRHGPIALAQLCISTDLHTTYVIDITRLGYHAFNTCTYDGVSLRRVFQDPVIRKCLYDPRNDSDALFHQFNIALSGVFDLQTAEVALRRSRGLNVRFVQGLFRCLSTQENFLTVEQKQFAELVNEAGKKLFEPDFGGSYDVFTQRPLHPSILVYASHDVRYLIPLMLSFEHNLRSEQGDMEAADWIARICTVSEMRAQWYSHEEYVTPTSEAPII